MKKILFLCSEDRFPVGVFRFVKQLAENETIYVKGLFIASGFDEEITGPGFMPMTEPLLKQTNRSSILLNESEDRFLAECEGIGVRYSIQSNESGWNTDEIVNESRFSDLVVISEELFSLNEMGSQPNYFTERVLSRSECAVVVVPEKHRIIDRLTVAYDGGRESMFALRQFIYLFPYFIEYPFDFVYIKDDNEEKIPAKSLLQEYTKSHFDSMFASKLHFDVEKYFSTWMEDRKNNLLISGAYSRSDLSNTLKKSFANKLISGRICPLFISHF